MASADAPKKLFDDIDRLRARSVIHAMESTEIVSLLEQLDDDIDDLEDSLAPILRSALTTTSSKLPLLDRARLYVLVTYAIESMLFSYLRMNGVQAREHPVFKELTRVKQYFSKIKVAESPPNERSVVTLNKQAAARFVKAGLSGNDEYDSKRANRREVDMARSHIKLDNLSKTIENSKSGHSSATDNSKPSHVDLSNAGKGPSRVTKTSKKRKAGLVDRSTPSSLSCTDSDSEPEPPHGKGMKAKEKKKRRKKNQKIGKDKGK